MAPQRGVIPARYAGIDVGLGKVPGDLPPSIGELLANDTGPSGCRNINIGILRSCFYRATRDRPIGPESICETDQVAKKGNAQCGERVPSDWGK